MEKWFYEIDCFQVYGLIERVLKTLKSTSITWNSVGLIWKVS